MIFYKAIFLKLVYKIKLLKVKFKEFLKGVILLSKRFFIKNHKEYINN